MEFRFATEKDRALILSFIRDLARYEKLEHEVIADEATLTEWIFHKHVAEVLFVLQDEKEVGFALFFHNFSTFVGKAGIYLEDLFVLPEYRGQGYGKALFLELARIAKERGCGRFEWVCLDWNTPSKAFYEKMGARIVEGWHIYRLDEAGISSLVNDTNA